MEGRRHLPKFTSVIALDPRPTPSALIILTLRGTDREKGGVFPV